MSEELPQVAATLLLFAKARELVGVSETSLTVPSRCTGRQLKVLLLHLLPQLAVLKVGALVARSVVCAGRSTWEHEPCKCLDSMIMLRRRCPKVARSFFV